MSLPNSNVCENCGGEGYYIYTRPDHRGEPEEIITNCECQDNEDFEE